MSTWSSTIQVLLTELQKKSGIPTPVIHLLHAKTQTEPAHIVAELDSGELAQLIRSLDPTSIQLGIEFASELRSQFEEAGAFEEAAAIDLLADRLMSQMR